MDGRFKNVIELFEDTAKRLKSKPALRYKKAGLWHEITWGDYFERAKKVARGLIQLGVRKGDRVAIIGENRWEWVVSDLGTLLAGGISVGLYPTAAPEQIEYALSHSESKIIFVEGEEQYDKLLEIKNEVNLRKIIIWDKKGLWGIKDESVLFFEDFLDRSEENPELSEVLDDILERIKNEISPDDVAFIVYTSGTTGPPKGAMITHGNVLFMTSVLQNANEADDSDEVISYLPLNHIAERLLSVYLPIRVGYRVNFVESFETLLENLREVRPTIFFSVPRIWEKIASQIHILIEDSTWFKRFLWGKSIEIGKRYAREEQRIKEELIQSEWERMNNLTGRERRKIVKSKVSLSLRFKYFLAYNLVLRHVKRVLGLHRVRYALCGAAPSAPELYEFFNALDVPLGEGYGQTESAGVITISRIGLERWGYVGTPVDGIEVKIADDGEILTRGPHVFRGYFKDDELTKETIKDSWLYTGDVGEMDNLGYLRILDRKKDIIITAGGKNITPSYIENKLKFSPYIQDAIVIGDGKKYLVALILIDEENISNWAQKNGVQYVTFEDLTKNPEVYKLIAREIDNVNKTLSHVETIKRFALIPRKLYEEEGDITPTKKIKRKVIEMKYKGLIERLYRD